MARSYSAAYGLLMTRRRQVHMAAGLVTVVAIFWWVMPRFASYAEVWPRLRQVGFGWLAALALLGAINLLAPAATQRAALPGLSLRRAAQSDWATTAVTNTIPGGSALALGLAWSMYRSWGIAPASIGRALVITGIWDNIIKLATPALALTWLAAERPVDDVFARAAIVGGLLLVGAIALLVLLLGSSRPAVMVSRALDRLPLTGTGWAARSEGFRIDTAELLRTRGRALTLWTMLGHINLYLLLLVCLRAVGIDDHQLSSAAVLAAFAFGRLATAVPLTPGGIGVMEVSLTASLDLGGTAPAAAVVAAVLLFRALTYMVPVPLGAISWLLWDPTPRSSPLTGGGLAWRHGRSRSRPPHPVRDLRDR